MSVGLFDEKLSKFVSRDLLQNLARKAKPSSPPWPVSLDIKWLKGKSNSYLQNKEFYSFYVILKRIGYYSAIKKNEFQF